MTVTNRLHAAAVDILPRAYAPYSQYPVAAAAIDVDGVIYTGVNIENASYGLTQCAEVGLVSSWRLANGAVLTDMVCINANGEFITPCGRCRQVLAEHAPNELRIATQTGSVTLTELLPHAFGPHNL